MYVRSVQGHFSSFSFWSVGHFVSLTDAHVPTRVEPTRQRGHHSTARLVMSASSLALALPTAHPRGRLGTRRGPVASLRASAADHPDPSRRPDAPSIDRDPSTSSSSSSSSSRRLVTLGGLAAATLALAPPPASRADESGPFCDFTQTLPLRRVPPVRARAVGPSVPRPSLRRGSARDPGQTRRRRLGRLHLLPEPRRAGSESS